MLHRLALGGLLVLLSLRSACTIDPPELLVTAPDFGSHLFSEGPFNPETPTTQNFVRLAPFGGNGWRGDGNLATGDVSFDEIGPIVYTDTLGTSALLGVGVAFDWTPVYLPGPPITHLIFQLAGVWQKMDDVPGYWGSGSAQDPINVTAHRVWIQFENDSTQYDCGLLAAGQFPLVPNSTDFIGDWKSSAAGVLVNPKTGLAWTWDDVLAIQSAQVRGALSLGSGKGARFFFSEIAIDVYSAVAGSVNDRIEMKTDAGFPWGRAKPIAPGLGDAFIGNIHKTVKIKPL